MTSYSVQNIGGATTILATFAVDPTPSPAPTTNPTTQPTAKPTNSPTQKPTASPNPTPQAPEFPSIALVAIMLVAVSGAILFYRRSTYNKTE